MAGKLPGGARWGSQREPDLSVLCGAGPLSDGDVVYDHAALAAYVDRSVKEPHRRLGEHGQANSERTDCQAV